MTLTVESNSAELLTMSARPSRGFTLIEQMAAVAIAATLAATAMPTFVGMAQRNRTSMEVNSFVGDLQYARAEAMRSGVPVSICPSIDGNLCLGTNSWQSGWIVFADTEGLGVLQTSRDVKKRARSGWSNGDTLHATTNVTAITFRTDGTASNLGGAAVKLVLATAPATPGAARCVVVNLLGHLNSAAC